MFRDKLRDMRPERRKKTTIYLEVALEEVFKPITEFRLQEMLNLLQKLNK